MGLGCTKTWPGLVSNKHLSTFWCSTYCRVDVLLSILSQRLYYGLLSSDVTFAKGISTDLFDCGMKLTALFCCSKTLKRNSWCPVLKFPCRYSNRIFCSVSSRLRSGGNKGLPLWSCKVNKPQHEENSALSQQLIFMLHVLQSHRSTTRRKITLDRHNRWISLGWRKCII